MRGERIESLGIFKETEHLLPYHIPASVCGGGGGGGCVGVNRELETRLNHTGLGRLIWQTQGIKTVGEERGPWELCDTS